jgi:hypothetical protein
MARYEHDVGYDERSDYVWGIGTVLKDADGSTGSDMSRTDWHNAVDRLFQSELTSVGITGRTPHSED